MHPGKLWAQRAISIFTLACSCATAQSVGDSSPARAEADGPGFASSTPMLHGPSEMRATPYGICDADRKATSRFSGPVCNTGVLTSPR
jgi:hypothetical protein